MFVSISGVLIPTAPAADPLKAALEAIFSEQFPEQGVLSDEYLPYMSEMQCRSGEK
jgi:hypothetical protein